MILRRSKPLSVPLYVVHSKGDHTIYLRFDVHKNMKSKWLKNKTFPKDDEIIGSSTPF